MVNVDSLNRNAILEKKERDQSHYSPPKKHKEGRKPGTVINPDESQSLGEQSKGQ